MTTKRKLLKTPVQPKNYLTPLGEKIFLDRYAWKDGSKKSLAVGDTVIVCVDEKTRQREIATVESLDRHEMKAVVRLRDETTKEVAIEHIDKPLETTPDQTMARIARGIAAVETEAKQAEWQKKFEWLLEDWKFVPGGRIWAGAGTDQELTFYNCMPPSQEVLTESGYRPIAEVNVGDMVVTHRNRLRRVLHKFERETEEPMYVIRPSKVGYDALRVTGEHKVLAIRSEWVNRHKSRDGLRLKQEAQWIPAQELKSGDFLAVAYDGATKQAPTLFVSDYILDFEMADTSERAAVYTVVDGKISRPQIRRGYHGHLEAGGTHYNVPNEIVVDHEIAYLIGRWLGDGCITHRTGTDIPSGIKITFGLDEAAHAEEIADIITRRFGVTARVKLASTGRWMDVWANSMPLGQFFKALLGCYSYGKSIPETLMHLPDELSLELLRGLFSADGYTSENKVGILLANRTLAIQTHQLLLRLGYFFSIYENTHRLAKHPSYRLDAAVNECTALFEYFFRQTAPTFGMDLKYYFEHDGLRWVRIKDIATETYKGHVLDIEVDEDHSFISAGVVVSNCYVVPSPHDSRGGIVKTLQQMMEIMSRGGGVGINVSSLRPRYGYVKGVNGRSSGAVSWGGLYSFVTGLIEQGGCLTPDTLVFTEKGLLRLDELVTHSEKGWRDHNVTMMTDEGPRQSRSVYNNGVADVLKVETDMGMTITGTPNHKVKVMTDEGPAWRRLDRLQTGDAIMVKLGQHQGQYQSLQHPALKHHNQDAVELPTVLDEKLAYFLGYFMGDGFMTTRDGDWRLGVSIAHDSYLMEEMPRLLADLFPGVNVRLQQKENDASAIYVVSNRTLKEFLRLNGLEKALSNAVSVPALIRQSPASVVGAFLQGLFEADGGLSHGYPSLMSVSKKLIDEVSTLLIGLGCPVKIDMLPDGGERYGTLPRWRARVHSFRGLAAYCANVGADPRSRFAACLQYQPDLSKEHTYVLPNSRYWVDPVLDAITLPQTDHRAIGERFAATDQPLRRKLLRYTRGDRNLTLSAYATLSEKHEEFATHAPAVNDTWFVFVDRVSAAGQSLTLDLEVDENHTYIANGLVTHNSRRGALMLICNDWHPDVVEFINSKREAGKITNANISVGISDAFMDAVKQNADWDLVFPDTLHPSYDTEWNGDLEAWQAKGYPVIRHKTVKAKEMWNQIIESAWASAEPGLWFRDRANKMSNSWYFSPLICTNPCVTADTLIYTADGLRRVGDLFQEGNNVNVVVDGRQGYAPTTSEASHVFRTGRKQIYRLQTKEGYYVRATGDHRIMTERGWVELQELTQADKIHILNRKGGFGTEGTQELGQVLGWLVGDGTIKEDRAILSFFGAEKQELAGMFAQNVENLVAPLTVAPRHYSVSPVTIKDRDEVRVGSARLRKVAEAHGLVADKFAVPTTIFTGTEGMQRGFLQALFTADGGFQDGGVKGASARLASNHLELLEGVQQLLLNFGIASRIYRNRRTAGYRNLPDGNGGLKSYWCEAQHELAITKNNLDCFAREIGFLMAYKQAKLTDYVQRGKRGTYSERFTAHVESITPDGIEDVYDLTEPMTHSFIGNGITLHNCGEQPLPSFGICNLGAVNLAKFVKDGAVDWESLGQTVRYATRFLDDVIDATPYFFPENAEQQGKERRVGLGVMGLAEMMIRLGLRYGSNEGNAFLDDLFKFFASEAYLASAENAAEKGSFPAFDAEKYLQSGFMQGMPEEVRNTIREKGARNVTLLTVAPTGTTGTMVSTSTGVEPYYFWSYFRKSRLGVHEEVVDVVQAWRDENPHANGELPDYFVTAMDLSPEDHVKVQAVVQKWIDSSISKTCNVPNHYTVEQTAELYQLMYDLGCKGGTIYRDGSRDEQVLNIKKEEPKAAEPVKEAPKTTELPSFPHISPNYTNVGDHKRKRARRLKGATYFVHTPIGKAFVTVNRNGDEEPFEVFANVGKVGSEGAAMSEALGRLVSLVLRLPSHITPSERLEMVVEQLGGIGGARSIGFGANRVASLPDALAQVLREDLEAHRQDEAAILLGEADPEPQQLELLAVTAQADLCPECGHASFIRIEGCKKCVSCGHAEC